MNDQSKFNATICTSSFQSKVIDLLPCNKNKKSQLINSMLVAYDLLNQFDNVINENDLFNNDDSVSGIKLDTDNLRRTCSYHLKEYLDIILSDEFNKNLPFDHEERNQCRELLYDQYRSLVSNDLSNNRKRKRDDESTSITEQSALEKLKTKYNLNNGDCPVFSFLPMYLNTLVNSTVKLVENLRDDRINVGINWDGGRHHAMKSTANGFCYLNDIVLLTNKLRNSHNKRKRITYIDFDLHHGDGVENAFKFSKDIQFISLHLFEAGFYPCTGDISKNSYNNINIPLKHGLTNQNLSTIVQKLIIPLIIKHKSESIIILCGADGLNNDHYNEWQLTIVGLTNAIISIMDHFLHQQSHLPLKDFFLLGGGGYNPLLTSRFYTYLTYKVLELLNKLEDQPNHFKFDDELLIIDHDQIEEYKPEYYKFWCYETEHNLDGMLFKRQINNNTNFEEYLNLMLDVYDVHDVDIV